MLNICQLHPAKYINLQNMSTNGSVRRESMNGKNKAFGGNILELLDFKNCLKTATVFQRKCLKILQKTCFSK